MDWNEILKEVISGSILIAVGGVAGWFGGLFKGKKESSRAIERKNEIYQPLIDEIEKYSDFDWSIREKVKVPFLRDIVNNSYKYGIKDEILNQCKMCIRDRSRKCSAARNVRKTAPPLSLKPKHPASC